MSYRPLIFLYINIVLYTSGNKNIPIFCSLQVPFSIHSSFSDSTCVLSLCQKLCTCCDFQKSQSIFLLLWASWVACNDQTQCIMLWLVVWYYFHLHSSRAARERSLAIKKKRALVRAVCTVEHETHCCAVLIWETRGCAEKKLETLWYRRKLIWKWKHKILLQNKILQILSHPKKST